MDTELNEEFANCLDEIVSEAKNESLAPILELIIEGLERGGFTLTEVVTGLANLVGDRGSQTEAADLDRIAEQLKDEL